MELKLSRDEIETILLDCVQRLLPAAAINRIEWDGYRTPGGATFEHTDVPEEKDGE